MNRSVRDDIRADTGAAAPPRDNGELVFEAPWQGRAFATAVAVIEHLGVGWDEFRARLMVAIEQAPDRSYYESWLVALEGLVTDYDLAGSLISGRGQAAPCRSPGRDR